MTVFTDDFTGTNGDLLENRTGWTKINTSVIEAQITSNRIGAVNGASGNNAGFKCTSPGSADHYCEATLHDSNHTDFPLVCRFQDISNFGFGLRLNAGNSVIVARRSGAIVTNIATISITYTAGDTFRIEVEGTVGRAYQNGVQIGTNYTADTFTSETSVGILLRDAADSPLLDDWESGPIGGGSTESGAATSEGTSTASGAGAQIQAGAAGADALSTGSATGAQIQAGSAVADGTATTGATGSTGGAVESGTGSAAGTATTGATGAQIQAGAASASGAATAEATGEFVGIAAGSASASGTASVGAVGVSLGAPQPDQGGGGGDGAFGEEWARLYPLKPKRKKKRRDARGIPAEWKEPAPAVPPAFKAPAPTLAGVETLRDLAAVAAMQPPREIIPPEWVEDDDEIELLLLA